MIHSERVKAESVKMEAPTSAEDKHIGQDRPKSSRSNVVGMWKKREEAMKAMNAKSKEKAKDIQCEEKKESSNQEIEHDFVQEDEPWVAFPPMNSKTVGSETNAPKPVIDTNRDENLEDNKGTAVASSPPRRSNIRDSWKKRAANNPSPQMSQPSPTIDKSADMHPRTTASENNAAAFDELKSKWKKFGVQKEDNPTAGSDTNVKAENEVKEKSEESPSPSRDSIDNEKTSASPYSSRATTIASRRMMGSKRFRSKYARKAPNSPDETSGITKAASADPVSPSHSAPFVKKAASASFSLDETVQSDVGKDSEAGPSFVPMHTAASTGSPKDSMQSPGSISKDIPIPLRNSPSRQDNVSEVGSGTSGISSLSSRAHRKLRDIRMKNQTRKEEDENNSKEITTNQSNESGASMPMDESADFNKSKQSVTENARPLHVVVMDVKEMVPDEFVSENNANLQSFKTAYDKTGFVQIANDMREEASSLFASGILNEGVQTAIDTLGLGDIFQTKSPKKVSRRAPSPVEEVAIEVEYVADTD